MVQESQNGEEVQKFKMAYFRRSFSSSSITGYTNLSCYNVGRFPNPSFLDAIQDNLVKMIYDMSTTHQALVVSQKIVTQGL